jgi:DNA polymerase V
LAFGGNWKVVRVWWRTKPHIGSYCPGLLSLERYFQIKHKLKQHGIVPFSSNYALYGDMSERMMSLIEAMVPAVEVYSIDKNKLHTVDTQT